MLPLAVALLLAPPDSARCPAAPAGAASAPAEAAVVVAAGLRDTVATATVCLAVRAGQPRIGSYHAELSFDSLAARVTRAERAAGGVRVENTTRPGVVAFAGAAPAGFDDGAAITLVLRLRAPGRVPALRLRILELNTAAGADLTGAVRITTPASR
jgi:hypothetical protein